MTKSPPQPAVSVQQCEHGVRHPHPCDDCLDRDIPRGRSLSDHPCYGIFATAPTKFGHRAYMTNHSPMYCERCGTELDRDKKQKAGAPLCWEPRTSASAAPPADGVLRDRVTTLYDAIKHGDEIHREWLTEAIDNHFAGLPVPPARSAVPKATTAPIGEAGVRARALEALKALDAIYDFQGGWAGNGCEHGFKPSKACPNEDCPERKAQILFEAAMAASKGDEL